MIGSSGSNGESVPNETMNPLFLFELIHTTVVPALMQNNWLSFASGILGFTLAESDPLVMSIVHADEGEPQVLVALHMFAGCSSSHTYLPFFCACELAELSRVTKDNKSNALQRLKCCRFVMVISLARADPIALFHFHSMMLTNFHAFWVSSNCNSPSLLMMSCAAGKRAPPLSFLFLSFNLISPAVRLKLFD